MRMYFYFVSHNKMIVPTDCENNSVRYLFASSPLLCAVEMLGFVLCEIVWRLLYYAG